MRLNRWIEITAGAVIAGFFAVPVFRSALGIGIVAYFGLTGALAALFATKFYLGVDREIHLVELLYMALSMGLFSWLLATIPWTASPQNYVDSAILIVGLLALVVLVPFTAGRRAVSVAFGGIVLTALGSALFVLSSYVVGSTRGYDVAFYDFYLTVSQAVGIGTVALTLYMLFSKRRAWWQYAGLAVLWVGLTGAQARGAVLFAVVISLTAVAYRLFTDALSRESIWAYLKDISSRVGRGLGILAVGGGLVYVALTIERIRRRFQELLGGGSSSLDQRFEYWRSAWDNVMQSPVLGYGLGANGQLSGATETLYPHNIVFQLWLDGGIIAVILAGLALSVPFAALYRYRQRIGPLSVALVGTFAFLLLDHTKSYDFYTARLLFIVGSLAVASIHLFRAE